MRRYGRLLCGLQVVDGESDLSGDETIGEDS